MKVALVGAELEENLGLRYMASSLEAAGHRAEIVPFNTDRDVPAAVEHVLACAPQITGLSMVFTGRAREFIRLAQALREAGYGGHLVAGGPFASFNCFALLQHFPAFDSVALAEGEELVCRLADHLDDLPAVSGLCYRDPSGQAVLNPSTGNPDDLDALPFPKRTTFHAYFDKPIASILTSRGCWRDCAFCSINAWYQRGGGRRFRTRSVENIVAEMRGLYFDHGVRIFNFQDDNFFLPHPVKAAERFRTLRTRLEAEGIRGIAIAVKARPDSITEESIAELDQLGLFRVFLGVENASENGLRHLNRRNTLDHILNALRILNDCDVHVAYNLLMFEPDTVMSDILTNLRFLERHLENPCNFCRAEAYAGTGLEAKLVREKRLLGDYFGLDYRLSDPRSEAFHLIANHAFFDRNFNDFGLHYFNMQVDFYFQLLRRFHPDFLTERLRAVVRSFIKRTNLDTHECLCRIYDFVAGSDPHDQVGLRAFARAMREEVDARSRELRVEGELILKGLEDTYATRGQAALGPRSRPGGEGLASLFDENAVPYLGRDLSLDRPSSGSSPSGPFAVGTTPMPYTAFAAYLAEPGHVEGAAADVRPVRQPATCG